MFIHFHLFISSTLNLGFSFIAANYCLLHLLLSLFYTVSHNFLYFVLHVISLIIILLPSFFSSK